MATQQTSYLSKKDAGTVQPEQQAAYIRELERRLAEAQANVRALVAAQIDAVLESGRTTPLLLRQAQVALQRSKEELEQEVSARTAELSEANARLVVANRELEQRESALRESERRFRAMADGTPVFVWVTDATGRIEFINRAWSEFFGIAFEPVPPGEWQTLLHPDDLDEFANKFMTCLQERRPFRAQARVRRHDGEYRWIDGHAQPRLSGTGGFLGMAGSSLDITEQKQMEEALRQSREEIRRLVATSFEGIWSVDRSGKTTFINQRAAEILGYAVEEIEHKNAFEFLMPDDVEAGRETLKKIVAGESGRVEAHARRKDGSEAVLLVSFSPIFDEHGEFHSALAMYSDITERKNAERALKETSKQLKEYSKELEARVRERTEELVSLQRRLVENVEAERLWVSQELHDVPMQEIYGLMYRIALTRETIDDPDTKAEIDFAIEKLQSINEDLRSITRELRPTTLTPFGLAKAIREHIEKFDFEHPELNLTLELMPDGKQLPEHVRLSLFRIYQMALINVIRHAEAKNIHVHFSFDEEEILLEIRDDGKGFVPPKRLRTLAAKGNYGLPGAAERAEAIGGLLEVISAPGKGTTVRVTAPMVSVS